MTLKPWQKILSGIYLIMTGGAVATFGAYLIVAMGEAMPVDVGISQRLWLALSGVWLVLTAVACVGAGISFQIAALFPRKAKTEGAQ